MLDLEPTDGLSHPEPHSQKETAKPFRQHTKVNSMMDKDKAKDKRAHARHTTTGQAAWSKG